MPSRAGRSASFAHAANAPTSRIRRQVLRRPESRRSWREVVDRQARSSYVDYGDASAGRARWYIRTVFKDDVSSNAPASIKEFGERRSILTVGMDDRTGQRKVARESKAQPLTIREGADHMLRLTLAQRGVDPVSYTH